MKVEIIIGIITIVPAFYFIGKWLNNTHKDSVLKPNKITIDSTSESIKNWIVGFIIVGSVGAILFFLFWLDSWDRLSPEEQVRIKMQKQLYAQDIKHCQKIVSAEIIDINNTELQRCDELMQEFEANASTDSGRQSGPYEY